MTEQDCEISEKEAARRAALFGKILNASKARAAMEVDAAARCRAALVELVALKALHDRIEAADFVTEGELLAAQLDYARRKPFAWLAAQLITEDAK